MSLVVQLPGLQCPQDRDGIDDLLGHGADEGRDDPGGGDQHQEGADGDPDQDGLLGDLDRILGNGYRLGDLVEIGRASCRERV